MSATQLLSEDIRANMNNKKVMQPVWQLCGEKKPECDLKNKVWVKVGEKRKEERPTTLKAGEKEHFTTRSRKWTIAVLMAQT